MLFFPFPPNENALTEERLRQRVYLVTRKEQDGHPAQSAKNVKMTFLPL
jgi:hypothetical protein